MDFLRKDIWNFFKEKFWELKPESALGSCIYNYSAIAHKIDQWCEVFLVWSLPPRVCGGEFMNVWLDKLNDLYARFLVKPC